MTPIRREAGLTMRLSEGEIARLDDAQDTTLRVTRGRIWVTMEHDWRDIVLDAGQRWTVDRDGTTIVQAQNDVCLDVMTGTHETASSSWRRRLARIGRFISRRAPPLVPYY